MNAKDKICSFFKKIDKSKVIFTFMNTAVELLLTANNLPGVIITSVTGAVSVFAEAFASSKTENDKNESFEELTKKLKQSIDYPEFELPDYCRTILYSELFDWENGKLPNILVSEDPFTGLKNELTEICRNDKDCDLNTIPLDKIAIAILDKCSAEIEKNPDMRNYLVSYRLYRAEFCLDASKAFDANRQYARSFVEPLFLHKDDYSSPVNLANLFVEPKYEILRWESPGNNFERLLKEFLRDNETRFLFIEGDAGCGKTTLAAWMNYHYMLKDEFAENVFGGRPLLTVRLRDLDKDILEKDGFAAAVRHYLGLGSLDELKSRFPNAILLLDGFDELCMIEKANTEQEKLLRPFSDRFFRKFKIIITSRPKFLRPTPEMKYESISLLHFDKEQREKWIENYTSPDRCNQKIDDKIRDYILNINDDKVSCICDTPMTLYMLAADEDAADYLDNDWSLYHHIFYSTLSKTEYNAMFPNPNHEYAHEIDSFRDVLYRISEEIAYEMYKKGNSDFYLADEQLAGIIEKLSEEQEYKKLHLEESTTQEIVRHCYALCNYWKANEDRGAVEFLHNNIRDFFLAEKIYRELDAAAKTAKASENESQCRIISRELCDLFSYGSLETNVMYFIYSRAEHNKNKGIEDFAGFEYKNRMIADIISDMSEGNLLPNSLVNTVSEFNPVQRITNIVKCTVQIYRMAYEPYLNENEYIYWITKKDYGNNLLYTLFDKIFSRDNTPRLQKGRIGLGSRSDFSKAASIIDFSLMNLLITDFHAAVFGCADLSGANLSGADLSGADLSVTDLSKADLSYAVLIGADLSGADLRDADLRLADLRGADLSAADLSKADLSDADLREADLREADLPDGFRSDDQNKQIEHLKSLNIPGLQI